MSGHQALHQRHIALRCDQRADGLYEVHGHLTDTKSHPFQRVLQPHITPAGQALHDIAVTLVIDAEMQVHDAYARLHTTPFDLCPGAAQALHQLKGLRIGKGWNRLVRERLGGAASCTHIVELLGPMATTAYQGLAPQRLAREQAADQPQLHAARVNSCYAYAAHRDVVAQLWPHLHESTPPTTTGSSHA